jgi:hypothetical protein
MSPPFQKPAPERETVSLIGSDKVEDDTALQALSTGITRRRLAGAPKYGNDNSWNWNDPARTRAVNDYYGVAI